MQILDDNVSLIPVIDSRLNFKDQYTFQVRSGGSDHTYRKYAPTSVSSNNVQFNVIPPNDLTATSRQVYMNFVGDITISAVSTAAGQQLVRVGHDGLRQFPISSIIDNMATTLNGQKMNIQLSRIIHPLAKYYFNDAETANTFLSASPGVADQAQNYEDLTPSNRNPLNPFSSSIPGGYMGRCNGFDVTRNDLSTASGQTLVATIHIDVIEPIFQNPWQFKHSSAALCHLNTFDLNATFITSWANRIWSHAIDNSGIAIVPNSIVGSVSQDCGLYVEFITPQEIATIPKMLKYNFSDFNYYITTPAPFAPQEKRFIQSNQIQLSVVPRNVYVWCRLNYNSLIQSCQETDTYFSISSVKIFWNNKDSIFSSASPVQLYSMALEKGYTVDYYSHIGKKMITNYVKNTPGTPAAETGFYPCGSVLCFEFGRDIPCDAMTAPGSIGNYNFSMQVEVTNLKSTTITPELYITTCVDGMLSLATAYGRTNTALLTPTDTFAVISKSGPILTTNDLLGQQGAGGDFWDSLKNTGADILKFLDPVNKFLKRSKLLSTGTFIANTLGVPIPGLPVATKVLEKMGYGMDEGGVRSGGAKMNRKHLSKMSHRMIY